jgi:octaprenyl-diphosphate synthase
MTLEDVRDHFQEELGLLAVQRRRILKNDIPGFDRRLGTAILSGGKSVRALVLFVFSRKNGVVDKAAPFCAACVELLHLASLIQDDVIDKADTRRNRPSARRLLGDRFAVLTGDFLSIRVLQEVEKHGCQAMLKAFLRHSAAMIEGEISQTLLGGDAVISEDEYLRVIEKKTASLFRLSAEAGALLSGRDAETADRFGRLFGTAFQILDDCLDFAGDSSRTGKDSFADLRNGLFTLPVIHFAGRGGDAGRLKTLACQGSIQEAVSLIQASGSLDYALLKADGLLRQAGAAAERCLTGEDFSRLRTLGEDLLSRIKEGVSYGV